jgi:hypothetical protein
MLVYPRVLRQPADQHRNPANRGRSIVRVMVRALSTSGCSLLVTALLLVGCGSFKKNPDALKQSLAAGVPLHSTSTQVLKFLDTQKIAHSHYQYTQASGNSIEAEMSVPAPHSLVQPTYDVIFRFDDKGSLTEYDVQYLGYIGR